MKHFSEMTLEELIAEGGYDCSCGHHHATELKFLRIGQGVVKALPEALEKIGVHKPFIVCDPHTKAAAWEKVKAVLEENQIPYVFFCFLKTGHIEPDEYAVGRLTMAFDPSCDCVIGIGSGVINDCCKVLAYTAGVPQMIIGTAPSMDGYASNSASMIVDKVKTSLYNACPVAILADTDIMKNAPARMLMAGFGDMIAKYIAMAEWRISHLVIGEYYCAEIAELMRASLRKIMANAPRIMQRDPEVIGAIAEGLILAGIAMAFAKISRPASGLEHYFSHIWEMRALEMGKPVDLHGIQVGVGSYLTFHIFDRLKKMTPDRSLALAKADAFDTGVWEAEMKRIFGSAAPVMIQKEKDLWHKNERTGHLERMNRIIDHWEEIRKIMEEELPDTASIVATMEQIGMPVHPSELGIEPQEVYDAFHASRDVRDKYLISSLLWDIGLLDDFELVL